MRRGDGRRLPELLRRAGPPSPRLSPKNPAVQSDKARSVVLRVVGELAGGGLDALLRRLRTTRRREGEDVGVPGPGVPVVVLVVLVVRRVAEGAGDVAGQVIGLVAGPREGPQGRVVVGQICGGGLDGLRG